MSPSRFKILVCRGPSCGKERNSGAVRVALSASIEARALDGIKMDHWSCFGRCTQGPNVLVRELRQETPEFAIATPSRKGRSAFYSGVVPEDADEIVDSHLVSGRVVRRLVRRRGEASLRDKASKDENR